MKNLFAAFKESKKLILCILAAYIVCVIVCAVHIADVSKDNEEAVLASVTDDITQAAQMTQSVHTDLVNFVVTNAKKIEELDYVTEDEILSVLAGIESSAYFQKALYVRHNQYYTADGENGSERVRKLWNSVEEHRKQGDGSFVLECPLEEGRYDEVIFQEITEADGTQGCLVAVYDCADYFELNIFSKLKDSAQLYLIHGDGIILDEYVGPGFDYPELLKSDNFFTRMLTLTDGSISSKKLIQNLKVNLYTVGSREMVLSSNLLHSDKIHMNIMLIQGGDQVAFIAMYDLNTLLASSGKTVKRTWIVLGIILLATFAANVLIWNYLRSATMRIERLAYVDDVTKGKNLNFFRTEAVRILAMNSETPYLIQRFDISNFRYLNEAYGHIRADEILKACVDEFEKLYSDKELCVRMSSDQFVTMTMNDLDVEQKRAEYEENINSFAREKGIRYPIKLKFGVYQVRKSDSDIDIMIDRANVARKSLLRSKTEYIAVYSDDIVQSMRKTESIEAEKEKALATGEFKVYLQAKWDIINDHVAGAEALVRWIKADGNMVFPDEFIPVFEENGFIEQLDFYMLDAVCKRMHEVREAGGTIYPISVNQSRVLLNNPDYIDKVRDIFVKYNIPREFVELEVTETSLADDREHMIDVLKTLKEENVRLDMDDFGSGYSSLNLLKDMPFDVLKIDREFFSESITSASSTLILQKIVEMANGLGLEVICEGVENQQQVDLLKEIGCRRVQGYFYARPVPMEDYIKKYCELPAM